MIIGVGSSTDLLLAHSADVNLRSVTASSPPTARTPVLASRRPASPSAVVAPPSGAPPQLVPLYDVDAPLRELYEEIADCPRCELARTRSRTVPGSGPLTSELMFI